MNIGREMRLVLARNRSAEMFALRSVSGGVSGLNSDIAKVKRLTHCDRSLY
jgi:hypothetical protein